MTARAAPWVALVAALAALGAPVARAEIRLEVTAAEGVLPDAARANVLAYLSLSRYRTRDDLDPVLIERLQARAAREARAALRPFGYYRATATAFVRTDDKGAGKHWKARVRIIPGPRVVWDATDVRIEGPGADEPYFREVLARHPLTRGTPLQHADYDALKGELQRLATGYGYLDARFTRAELRVDPAGLSAQALLTLDTGPRYRFGATTLNQDVLDAGFVKRYLRWHEGEPFDASLLLRTQLALDDSLYFSTVELVPGERDPATLTVPMTVQLASGKRNRYAVSVGYATDTQGRASATWDDRRVNRRGHRSRVAVQHANLSQQLDFSYTIPVGDPALEKLTGGLNLLQESLADADTRSVKLRGTLTQALGQWQRVIGLAVDHTQSESGSVRTTDTLVVPSLSYAAVPRGFAREAVTDTAGDGPGRGFYAELQGSTTVFGSRSTFLRLALQDERAFKLTPQWRLLVRGQVGTALVRNFEDLPAQYRFFTGGDRSVRGFALNDLSPTDAQGLKTGGKHLLVASIEAERALPRSFGVAFFADAGNAVNSPSEGLAVSLGVGLRYRLPMVTLGIDLAQAVSVPGGGDRPGPRLHLNIAPVF